MYLIRQEDVAPKHLPVEGPARFSLPQQVGEGYSQYFEVEAGLGILETRYRPHRDFAYDSVVSATDRMLVITIGLEGVSEFACSSGTPIEYRKGFTSLTTFRESEGRRRYFPCGTTHQLRMLAGEAWLNRNLGEESAHQLLSPAGPVPRLCMPTAPVVASSLQKIETLGSEDARARLLRRGLALTVIASELARLENAGPSHAATSLSPRDARTVRKARELLQANIVEPPTLRELAELAGTNESKLKAGFHALYGSTPHRMLFELRMQHAWKLLSESGCQVSAAAYAVGYRHPGNFSAAFARHFGVAAKSVKRAR